MHLRSMRLYSTLMADTCMTSSCTSRKVCLLTYSYHNSTFCAIVANTAFVPSDLLHGAGDKLVLLADVDKHGTTDLIRLLNR